MLALQNRILASIGPLLVQSCGGRCDAPVTVEIMTPAATFTSSIVHAYEAALRPASMLSHAAAPHFAYLLPPYEPPDRPSSSPPATP